MQDKGTPASKAPEFNGRKSIGTAFLKNNVPIEAVEIVLASLAPAIAKQYESALRQWWIFCNENGFDFYTPTRDNLLKFLTKDFENGASYGTLNTFRSAISLISQDKLGEDLMVARFLKGVYKLKPSRPKYTYVYMECIYCFRLS